MIRLKDLYASLEVPSETPQDQLTRAYRSIAKRAHPDLAGGDHATMAAATQAWRVLGDPVRRLAYDTWRSGRQGESLTDVEGRFISAARERLSGLPPRQLWVTTLLATADAYDVLVETAEDPAVRMVAGQQRDLTRHLAERPAPPTAGSNPTRAPSQAQYPPHPRVVVPSIDTLLAFGFLESIWQVEDTWLVIIPVAVVAGLEDARNSNVGPVAARASQLLRTIASLAEHPNGLGEHRLVSETPAAETSSTLLFPQAVHAIVAAFPPGTEVCPVVADP
ncbi:MAG: DnaJ domain-containing protein, partial [Chloroflexota bacterium]|nr:DnaJ domain-containing protein [Chloroflexota bacterium]